MSRKYRYLLSILSGLLLVVSFPYTGSITPFVFLSLIPLFLVENSLIQTNRRGIHLFPHTYLTFFIFNFGTTWWIWNSSDVGATLAFVFNTLLMALAFQLYHFIHRKLETRIGIWSVVIVWTAFEWLHYNWELSWPWLSFGNFFSTQINWVQWYEYTGGLGGTVWILISNVIGFKILLKILKSKKITPALPEIGMYLLVVISPIILSYLILLKLPKNANNTKIEVVVVQPNIDPYNEKFDPNSTVESQLTKIFMLVNPMVNQSTNLIICPETAISQGFIETELQAYSFYELLQKQLQHWKKTDLLIGASTYNLFESKRSRASIKIPNQEGYYESYNSSLYLSRKNKASFIHKSKLVLGVEKIPFSQYFPFLEAYSISNGGTTGTLGIEEYPKIFKRKLDVAPIICYESIYGEFVAKQAKQGADFLCIMTNDGWWGNTPGHKQHFSFAKLRAIENRKWVARSANTGISGFINDKGEVIQKSNWWTPDALKQEITPMNKTTFYASNGDYIGRFSAIMGIILFPIVIFKKRKNQS